MWKPGWCTPVILCLVGAASSQQVQPGDHAGYRLADGSVQIIASARLAGAVRAINQVFAAKHPGVRFTVRAGDNYSAMAALTFDRSVVAPLGSEYTRIGLGDNLKIAAEPIGIRIAHATLTAGEGVPMLGVVVHPANPLTSLSMSQLVRLFAVGGPVGDLATWGQAGVAGPLANENVHPTGPMASDYADSEDPQAGEFLSVDKLGGLSMNHRYVGLAQYAEVVHRVRQDPAAIGIVALNQSLVGVKVIALRSDTGKPSTGSTLEIAAGSYPLDRFVYLYLRVGKGAPVDDFAKEYVRVALSEEGQRAIAAEAAGYIPLSAGELAQERGRLDR
jgi:phosphate transport system substrate-binding protein